MQDAAALQAPLLARNLGRVDRILTSLDARLTILEAEGQEVSRG